MKLLVHSFISLKASFSIKNKFIMLSIIADKLKNIHFHMQSSTVRLS